MSIKHQYHIFLCQNPDCRLRFPAPANAFSISACPKCGSTLATREIDYTNTKPQNPPHTGNNLSVSIALDNLRSAYNVGSIFRTADAAAIEHIHLYGITPTPDNPKIKKTSLSAEFAIPWTQHNNALDHLNSIKNQYQIWAIEGDQNAASIFDPPPIQADRPILLVFGSENAGIDPAILRLTDTTIYIPMIGFKRSLNVASAFAIAVYTLRFTLS